MITRRPVFLGLGASLLAGPLALAVASPGLSGTWTGVLDDGFEQLRLRFELREDGTATMYSLDRGGKPIPARIASLTAEHMEIEIPMHGTFRGKASTPDRIEGIWIENGDWPLVLMRGEAGLVIAPVEPLTNQALEEQRRSAQLPALVAAVAMKDQGAKKWVAGERLAGSGVAVTANDSWHLGSITKSITSTLVARLVELNAVSWDDTVGDVLKNVAPDMQDAYRSVSFRHLLSHRAGLPSLIPTERFSQYSRDATNVREERRNYVREALRMNPIGPKETTFSYANNGYVVAGAMLEARLDATWEDLVRRQVFEPLKLTSAGFGAPGEKGKLTQPVGHIFKDKRLIGRRLGEGITDNPYAVGPAGRVHMSLDDVLTYLAQHRDASPFLRPDTWRTLHTPPFGGDYAMGWVKLSDGALWHDGSNGLWYAEVLFHSGRGVSAVAASNEGGVMAIRAAGRTLRRALAAAA